MARYKMDDGVVVDTEKAQTRWEEKTRWNGNNHISVHTGDQWCHETLYKSSKGRYYIVSWSDWQGSTPEARWVSDEEAVGWLLLNGSVLPEDLAVLSNDMVE